MKHGQLKELTIGDSVTEKILDHNGFLRAEKYDTDTLIAYDQELGSRGLTLILYVDIFYNIYSFKLIRIEYLPSWE